jgi:hypothetical protein
MEMVGIFIALFITHAIAIYAGWRMGVQRDKQYVPPAPVNRKPDPYHPIDEIDQERLDYK